jgi:hypothetical protein
MNCGEFETIVGELARGRGPEESLRQVALAHARDCAGCALRLVEERELAGELGRFAASMAGRAAPSRVEAALLQAFDRHHAVPPVRRRALAMSQWAFAAAAALALVAAAAWFLRPRSVVPPPPAVANRPVVTPAPVTMATPPAPVRRVTPPPKRPHPHQAAVARFYPLGPQDGLADIQGGTIVRIGMPRAALASFGLPLDPDNTQGRIEADVILDNDTGMARAIRFVGSRP